MKKSRIFRLLIITILVLLILSSKIYAFGDWISQAEGFVSDGKAQAELGTTIDTAQLKSGSDVIYNALLAIGTVVAVIVGAILGIQFMTAGIDKKVEVKQALVPYIVSCIVLFGALGIWKLIIVIMKDITI